MADPIAARISRLLDQLEKKNLTDEEIAKIKSKVEYLKQQQE